MISQQQLWINMFSKLAMTVVAALVGLSSLHVVTAAPNGPTSSGKCAITEMT
jgi:hypothetical protein